MQNESELKSSKTALIFTEADSSIAFGRFEQLARAGIRDVLVLLSPEQMNQASEKQDSVVGLPPASTLDIFQETADKHRIRLRVISNVAFNTDDDKLKFFLTTKAADDQRLTAAIFVPSQALGSVAKMQGEIPSHLTIVEDAQLYAGTIRWLCESTKGLLDAIFTKIQRAELSVGDKFKLLNLRAKAMKTHSDFYTSLNKTARSEQRFETANLQWWKEWEKHRTEEISSTTSHLAKHASEKRQEAYDRSHVIQKKLMDLVQEFDEFLKAHPTMESEEKSPSPSRPL